MDSISGRPVELIFYGGPIYSADASDSTYTGMAVSEGRIIALGESDAIRSLEQLQTRVVNLKGRSIIPGIVDSHNHLLTAGEILAEGILLFDLDSISALQTAIEEKARQLPPGRWLRGAGWIESQFAEWRLPTRQDLDQVAPEHPVILDRLFGMSVANSKALEAAGIDEEDPPGVRGRIDRDETGRPTGILRDGAQSLVYQAMPRPGEDEQLAAMTEYIATAGGEYIRYGITSVVDPGVTPMGMRAYQRAREANRLPLRVNMMPAWYGLRPEMHPELPGRVDHLGVYTGFGDAWLRLGALKMALDGGLGSRTAWMNHPFSDGTYSEIPLRLDRERLGHWMAQGHDAGWSIGVHCCGDRAQDEACRLFAQVIGARPERTHRHNIIHGYFPTDESLCLMAEHDVSVSLQPGFIWVEGDLYPTIVDEEMLKRFKPIKTYLQRGIRVVGNTDMTSAHYNPFWGIHSAVTRRTAQGLQLGTKEAVDRMEALKMFTINGADLTLEADEKGSLEKHKRADLVVLNDDFGAIPADGLRSLGVDMTVIGGRIVFEANSETGGG